MLGVDMIEKLDENWDQHFSSLMNKVETPGAESAGVGVYWIARLDSENDRYQETSQREH